MPFEEWLEALTQAGFQDVDIINAQPLRNRGNIIVNELKKDWLLIKDLAEKVSRQPGLMARLQKNAAFMKKCQGYFGFSLVYGRKPIPKRMGFKEWVRELILRKKLQIGY